MSTITWFGWFRNLQKNSDKIWGVLRIEDTYYYFWAKRNSQVQFKKVPIEEDFFRKIDSKSKKGYNEIASEEVDTVWPDFNKTVESQLFIAKMRNKVRNE